MTKLLVECREIMDKLRVENASLELIVKKENMIIEIILVKLHFKKQLLEMLTQNLEAQNKKIRFLNALSDIS